MNSKRLKPKKQDSEEKRMTANAKSISPKLWSMGLLTKEFHGKRTWLWIEQGEKTSLETFWFPLVLLLIWGFSSRRIVMSALSLGLRCWMDSKLNLLRASLWKPCLATQSRSDSGRFRVSHKTASRPIALLFLTSRKDGVCSSTPKCRQISG